MSYIVKAGTPYLRYTDPMIPQVDPRGLQPQSSYIAPLAYFLAPDAVGTFLSAPPDSLNTSILLFGCDYPQRFTGTQYYGTGVFDEAGDPLLIDNLTFTVPTGLPYGLFGLSVVPQLLAPTYSPVRYQEKLTGQTLTNGLTVTGFPFFGGFLGHNVWATDSGNAGDRAGYSVELNVALNGDTIAGPASFLQIEDKPQQAYQPVILWEPDFTQQMIDDGFRFTATSFNGASGADFLCQVVGIWAGYTFDGEDLIPYLPVPQGVGLRSAAPAGDAPVRSAAEVTFLNALRGKR